MEEIRTNIDKIFDQLMDTPTIPVPKKLSFDCLGDSFEEKYPAKSKIPSRDSLSEKNCEKRRRDESPNSSAGSANNSTAAAPSSPWEMKMLKADLMVAKANITQLQGEVEHQHLIRKNMEKDYTFKIDGLKDQVGYFKRKCHEVEKHLADLQKREAIAKEDLVQCRNEKKYERIKHEEIVHSLQRKLARVEENFRTASSDYNNDVSDLQRQLSEVVQSMTGVEEENTRLFALNETLQQKLKRVKELEASLEEEKQRNEVAARRIKELEFEISGYGEWKEVSTSAMARLSKQVNLEKENERLKTHGKSLYDAVGNKLLLEEQVINLKSRLEKSEKNNVDAIDLKIQMTELEKELNQWKAIAVDHCAQNSPATPQNLRQKIEEILHKDVVLVSERNKSNTERKSLEVQSHDLRTQNESLLKINGELQNSVKNHQGICQRLQKKMLLLAKERDCYKQLIENYEKDLTISGPQGAVGATPENQLRLRVDMLEKTLAGYKEMCTNLEKDLNAAKGNTEAGGTTYEHLRKELTEAQMDNERLRRRKDELELELEHRYLKGDFNADKFKVVHMSVNPAATAYENHLQEVEKLQAEIERLKRKIRKFEEDHDTMTMCLNESNNITMNMKELNTLRSQVASLESKNQHLKDVSKSFHREFRDFVDMLLGYRIIRTGNTNYRISSMYAENEGDYLNFRFNDGILDMLETEYSISLQDMVRTHLGAQNCFPAFLSALTLDLISRTTVEV